MTTQRSDAYITQQDMEGNWDRRAERRGEDFTPQEKQAIADANAERLAKRLVEYCSHGGRMKPLPGLPHAVAVRFDPVEEETEKEREKKEREEKERGEKALSEKEAPEKEPSEKKPPKKLTPKQLYVLIAEQLQRFPRWPHTQDCMISRSEPLEDVLVYVDGSCSDQQASNNATKSKALRVVVFKPAQYDSIHKKDNRKRGLVFGFESYGPTSELHPATSDGAVLRAAIAAIESFDWVKEGRTQLTIASDSAYLVEGITDYIGTWRQRGWRDSAGQPVANRDLWEKLLSQVNLQAHWGLRVRFWLIDKARNVCAEEMAKHAPINLEAESARGLVTGK
jgi:ribonuclease HI